MMYLEVVTSTAAHTIYIAYIAQMPDDQIAVRPPPNNLIGTIDANDHQEIERLVNVELLAPTNRNPDYERSY